VRNRKRKPEKERKEEGLREKVCVYVCMFVCVRLRGEGREIEGMRERYWKKE
jgi:hypothetical protein